MTFKQAIKNNWDLIPAVILAIILFTSYSSNFKLVIGGVYFIFLGLISSFKKGTFSEASNPLNYYISKMLITIGLFSLLTVVLLPKLLNFFIITFILIVITEALLFYFNGPKIWFKYFLYVAFIIPIIGILVGLFSGTYLILLNNNFTIMTFITLSLCILGIILMIQLFYWPIELFKHSTHRNIAKHLNKINLGVFISVLIISIFYISSQWGDQKNIIEKFSLILSTIISTGILFTLVKGILYLFKKTDQNS